MKSKTGILIFGLLSLMMALAPFRPEPHLLGKIKWVLGGANGMQFMDWFDLILHGGPITVFLVLLPYRLKQSKSDNIEAGP